MSFLQQRLAAVTDVTAVPPVSGAEVAAGPKEDN